MNLQRTLFIAAIGAATSLTSAAVSRAINSTVAPSSVTPASPAPRGGVESRGVSGQPAATPGADTNANHPQETGNRPAGNNANASGNQNSNGEQANNHRHRHIAQGQTLVPLYGYVPYNGLYNEGFGYDNGWYDYPGPYVNDNNSGYVDDTGFTSSNTNGTGSGAPIQPQPLSQPQPTTSNSLGASAGLSPDALGARAQMIEAQARIIKEYQAKPEYESALSDLKKATDDFNAAVTKARASLQQSPEYQQANAQKQQADQQVEAQQASHPETPTTSRVNPDQAGSFSLQATKAAEQKLHAKVELTDLQKKAIGDNPAVKASRAKLDAAIAQFNGQKAKLTEVVMADKDWQAAKQKYDAAATKG